MFHLFAVALFASAAGEPPQIQPADIVAGYRQNFGEFRTLHLQWKRVLTNAENFFKDLEAAARDLEEQSARQGIDGEERAKLLSRAQGYRGAASHPKNIAPEVFRQDFWTDRTGFQMRLPSPKLGDREKTWDFPRAVPKIDTEALPTEYKDTAIICFNGRIDDGFRVWDGFTRNQVHLGGILKAFAGSDLTHFPPLGFVNPEWGPDWHPFDQFFAGPIEQLRVVREEELAGRRTYVLERVSESSHKESRLTPEDFKKYGDRLRILEIVRAWIDPAQGYLPLKMEWDGEKWYDGKRLPRPEKKIPSFSTIDNVEIRKVAGTQGYYPVRCEMHLYAVEAGFRGPFVTVGDVIEGKKRVIAPMRLHQECRWEVSLVEANRDMSGLLSLPFPDNTTFYDARQSRAFLSGDAEKIFDEALATQQEPPRAATWTTSRLVVGGILATGLFVMALVRLSRSQRRRDAK